MKINNGYALKGLYFRKQKGLATPENSSPIMKNQSNTQSNPSEKQGLSSMKSLKANNRDPTIPPLNLLFTYNDNRIKSKKNDQFDNNPYQHTEVSTSDAIDDILSVSMLVQGQTQREKQNYTYVNENYKKYCSTLFKPSTERTGTVTKIMPIGLTHARNKEENDKKLLMQGLIRNNTNMQNVKSFYTAYNTEDSVSRPSHDINNVFHNDHPAISVSSINGGFTKLKPPSSVFACSALSNRHRRTGSLNTTSTPSSQFQTIISYADLLQIEDNLHDILSVLTLSHLPEDQCLQWWINYFSSSFRENYAEYFLNEANRRKIKVYANMELLCVLLCYILSTSKEVFNIYIKEFNSIFASLHFNLLLLIKFILIKQKGNDIHYDKISQMIKRSLTSVNERDIEEFFITSLITHNLISISEAYVNIIRNAFKDSDDEDLLCNYLSDAYHNRHCINIDDLNRFFKEVILKEDYEKNQRPNRPNAPYLPIKNRHGYTLVLDLDETLVHLLDDDKCIDESPEIEIRPGLFDLLKRLKNKYEIVLFTAATQDYADTIIDIIEYKEKYFDFRLYREHTVNIGNEYVKDLRKLGRDLSKVLIVDDKFQNYSLQKENGILIQPFINHEFYSNILGNLGELLITIYNEGGDVRETLVKYKEYIINKISRSN